MLTRIGILIVVMAITLLFIGTNSLQSAPVKNADKIILLQDIEEGGDDGDKKEEADELEEDEGDYKLGKVNTNTKKAVYYECPECGDIQLEAFKCPICEKDAEKKEVEVEEKNGKWYEKGTNTQIVEKEPEEEEDEPAEEKKDDEKKEENNSKPQGGKKGGPGLPEVGIIESIAKIPKIPKETEAQ